MAWLPGLTKRNIPPGTNDPPFIPIGVVWHVRAGRGATLYDYFNGPSGGIEAHGYIRYDGSGEQYRDTDISVDAQAAGNWWVGADGQRYGYIAFETEGVCGENWTPEQLNTMVRISRQVHLYHGIPYTQCSGPKRAGHGYHSQFNEWNPHNHACPCTERIRQFPTFIKSLPPPPPIITQPPKELDEMKAFVLSAPDADPGVYLWTVPDGIRPLTNSFEISLALAAGAEKRIVSASDLNSLVVTLQKGK
jgi:hypothetical protein